MTSETLARTLYAALMTWAFVLALLTGLSVTFFARDRQQSAGPETTVECEWRDEVGECMYPALEVLIRPVLDSLATKSDKAEWIGAPGVPLPPWPEWACETRDDGWTDCQRNPEVRP